MVEKQRVKKLQEEHERIIAEHKEFVDKGVNKYVQNFHQQLKNGLLQDPLSCLFKNEDGSMSSDSGSRDSFEALEKRVPH